MQVSLGTASCPLLRSKLSCPGLRDIDQKSLPLLMMPALSRSRGLSILFWSCSIASDYLILGMSPHGPVPIGGYLGLVKADPNLSGLIGGANKCSYTAQHLPLAYLVPIQKFLWETWYKNHSSMRLPGPSVPPNLAG